MIRFTAHTEFADRCSWAPTYSGIVLTVWHSNEPERTAQITLGPAELPALAQLVDDVRRHTDQSRYISALGLSKPRAAEGGGK